MPKDFNCPRLVTKFCYFSVLGRFCLVLKFLQGGSATNAHCTGATLNPQDGTNEEDDIFLNCDIIANIFNNDQLFRDTNFCL